MPNLVESKLTLLITHYNRSESLKKLLSSLEDLDLRFKEIIISDDCSKQEHQDKIKELSEIYNFTYISGEVNRGLGNNLNKGIAENNTDYLLYIQEDFLPNEQFKLKLNQGLELLETDSTLDIVRYYAYVKYPYLQPYKYGFSKMTFNFFKAKYMKFHYYSDHPHLRRANFVEKFGEYEENLRPDKTEYKMVIKFLQRKGTGIFYNDYQGLFSNSNDENEPSTYQESSIRQSKNILVFWLRNIYRQLKYHFDFLFMRHSA